MTPKEYNETVDTWADGVYRFIRKSLKSDDDAQDIVQNAFRDFVEES